MCFKSINIIFFIAITASFAFGQGGDNPFEITEAPATEQRAVVNPRNPFEILPNGSKQLPTDKNNLRQITKPEGELATVDMVEIEEPVAETPTPTEAKPEPARVVPVDENNPFALVENGNKASYKPRKKPGADNAFKINTPAIETSEFNISSTIKFIVILIIVAFLAFIRTSYQRDLSTLYKSFTSPNILSLQYRDIGTLLRFPDLLLYVLLFFTGGAMIFLLASYFKINLHSNSINALLLSIGAVAGIVLLRHLTLAIIAAIFPFKEDIRYYNYTIGIFYQILGLLLIPFIIFIAFTPPDMQLTVIYASLGIVGLFYIYRLIRLLPIASKYLSFHKFHFILYLCTVEIAPMAILVKVLFSGG